MLKSLSKAIVAATLFAATAQACTIPVFRYALDRWQADDYGLMASEAWWDGDAGRAFGAIQREFDPNLSGAPPAKGAADPQLLRPEDGAVLWSGALDKDVLARITHSPAREELAKRIVSGESAVWVLVESGDKAQDDLFATRLEERLEYLEQVATIPPQDPNDPDSQLGPGPDLRVDFSVLRVKRDDPQEEFLRKMLVKPGGESLSATGQPFAALVFARGRVLGAWGAEELDDEGIDEVCLFLLGACSCRVKSLNPGWELLMAVNWDERLMAVEMAAGRDPEARTAQAPEEALPELEVVEFGKTKEEEAASQVKSRGTASRVAMMLLVTLLAAIFGWKMTR